MQTRDSLFELIRELVMCHSPSGVEAEVDRFLEARLKELGLSTSIDAAGNLIARIPGQGGGKLAITAHKDEIGCIVTAVQADGKLKVRNLGGAFPWVYGEGIVDLLGDNARISGVLCFGSRHVSHAAPQKAQQENSPLRWQDAWIETKCTDAELIAAGVRPGTRMVIGKHRKAPFRLKDHIASYTLDNKASLAILLQLAERLKQPLPEVILIATAKEEVGAMGALYFTQREAVDAVIALEICPLAAEYAIQDGPSPVLLMEDGAGLYDDTLNSAIRQAATARNIPLQLAVISGFGSDASIAMKQGHVARAACLSFPTQNTHGYEIAHLDAIQNCVEVLESFCTSWRASP